MRHRRGSVRLAADVSSKRGRDCDRARADLRCGICGADLFEWIYRVGYEVESRAGGGAIRNGVQHRWEHWLRCPWSSMEGVRMAGRGGFDRYRSSVDHVAG